MIQIYTVKPDGSKFLKCSATECTTPCPDGCHGKCETKRGPIFINGSIKLMSGAESRAIAATHPTITPPSFKAAAPAGKSPTPPITAANIMAFLTKKLREDPKFRGTKEHGALLSTFDELNKMEQAQAHQARQNEANARYEAKKTKK